MRKRSKVRVSRHDANLAYEHNKRNPFLKMPPLLLAKLSHIFYEAILNQEVDVEDIDCPLEKIRLKYVSRHLMFSLNDNEVWKTLVAEDIYPIELINYSYEKFYYDRKWVESTYEELVEVKHKKNIPYDRDYVLTDLVSTLEKLYDANDLESGLMYGRLTVEYCKTFCVPAEYFPTDHEYAMEMLSDLIQKNYKTTECNELIKKIIATHGLNVKDISQECEVNTSNPGEGVKTIMVTIN